MREKILAIRDELDALAASRPQPENHPLHPRAIAPTTPGRAPPSPQQQAWEADARAKMAEIITIVLDHAPDNVLEMIRDAPLEEATYRCEGQPSDGALAFAVMRYNVRRGVPVETGSADWDRLTHWLVGALKKAA